MNNEDKAVIIDTPYKVAAKNTDISDNSYKGLRIHAFPGLHEFVSGLIQKYLPHGGSIIDLASGSGAMCARLADLGYKLTALDYVKDNFKLHNEISFYEADLNSDFVLCIEEQFDCVLAMEIIEHLENPRAFIRSATRLCKKGGLLILTTPNIASPASKVQYLKTGTFEWFNEDKYYSEGHINPVSPWVISKIFEECDIEILYKGSFDAPFRRAKDWLKLKLLTKFISAISKEPRKEKGEIFAIVGRINS